MKYTYKQLLLLSAFVMSASVSQSQDPNFHIYLLFGQSNMEGAGTIESQDREGVDERFRVMGATTCSATRSFTQGEWSTAEPPLVRCYTGLGIGDYFGRTMIENLPAHIKVGVVPVAIGGCDIALFDKENYATYVESAPDWMKNIIAEYGNNPYGRLVDVARLAQEDGVIKGILFHQGETNTNQSSWKTKVAAVVQNLKTDLELDDIPFLAGEVYSGEGNCCGIHNTQVNLIPDHIPNAHVISSEGLAGADEAHFTSAAYRTYGERYATKMLELIEVDSNPVTAIENDFSKDNINIYPVPVVNGIFTFENIEEFNKIELFNAMGRKLGSFENTDLSPSMKVQMKTGSGIVLVRFSNGQKTEYMKVLVH